MFLRFVTTEIDEDSHLPKGVIIAAYSLLDSGDLNLQEWERLRVLMDWFEKNLPSPPDNFYAGRAIFWFRSEAKENIDRLWEVIAMLRENGCHIEVLKCRSLKNICFSDRFQVAAYPSELDGRITKT